MNSIIPQSDLLHISEKKIKKQNYSYKNRIISITNTGWNVMITNSIATQKRSFSIKVTRVPKLHHVFYVRPLLSKLLYAISTVCLMKFLNQCYSGPKLHHVFYVGPLLSKLLYAISTVCFMPHFGLFVRETAATLSTAKWPVAGVWILVFLKLRSNQEAFVADFTVIPVHAFMSFHVLDPARLSGIHPPTHRTREFVPVKNVNVLAQLLFRLESLSTTRIETDNGPPLTPITGMDFRVVVFRIQSSR